MPKKKIDIVYPWESEEFKNQWELWKQYRKEQHNFEYKSRITEQAALKKLSRLANSEEEAIAIIEQSFESGWKGFFELKKDKNAKGESDAYSTEFAERIARGLASGNVHGKC